MRWPWQKKEEDKSDDIDLVVTDVKKATGSAFNYVVTMEDPGHTVYMTVIRTMRPNGRVGSVPRVGAMAKLRFVRHDPLTPIPPAWVYGFEIELGHWAWYEAEAPVYV